MLTVLFGGRYNNSEISTSKCFFWYLRKELNGAVMISFIVLNKYSSLVKYEVEVYRCKCAEIWFVAESYHIICIMICRVVTCQAASASDASINYMHQ